jgi:hypothetical protein
MSPISTLSPTFLCHLMRIPSVMVSESFGMSMVMGMVLGQGWVLGGENGETVDEIPVFSQVGWRQKSAGCC